MLRAFLGPFAVTLPVALFILDMQFLWVYADDMIGKGLELWVVFKLMVFASARLVNLALPLAVLVASIMALGNLAERNELTAMKASGMSFLRILRPLVVCMVFLCGGALWFSNTGWPAANMKFRALLYSVTKQKPAFNLREGVFYNGIDGFSIRVGTKHADGRLEDLLVHDHRDTKGQRVLVVQAERGHMSESDGHLVIELEDGVSYEEHQETMSRSKERVYPHVRSSFQRQTLRIPLHSLDFSMANEDLFRRSYERMTLAELAQTGDSLGTEIRREGRELQNYGKRNVAWRNDTTGWYASAAAGAQPTADPLGPPASPPKPEPAPFIRRRNSRATKSEASTTPSQTWRANCSASIGTTLNGTASTSWHWGAWCCFWWAARWGRSSAKADWACPRSWPCACSCCITWSPWSASNL